jgi:hypothetical protein
VPKKKGQQKIHTAAIGILYIWFLRAQGPTVAQKTESVRVFTIFTLRREFAEGLPFQK